jgi:1,2-phenylacetyl-CoA epoxidase PaaB subunit
MSKLRQQLDLSKAETPIDAERLGDFKPYVIFTQLKENGPHIYAGWLEAVDDDMALMLAKEHYGQDQACTNIWAISREHLASSDGLYTIAADEGFVSWVVFTQKNRGDVFLEAGQVQAQSPTEALAAARQAKPQAAKAHCVWVVPPAHVLSTKPDDMIWRNTDQTYRLARGYTKIVKEKWQRFRGEDDLAAYEKDDLKEAF